jgi:hypothetical protein
MFKRLAANPQRNDVRNPALRIVAFPTRSDAGALGDRAEDDTPPEELDPVPSPTYRQHQSDADAAFERAVARWVARGYQVLYRDEYLVQLVRRHRPDWLLFAFVLAGLAGLLFLAAIRRARLARPWHVVTLARTFDERVVTHEQWTDHPPAA